MLKELKSKTLIFIFITTTLAIILGHLILSFINGQMGGGENLSLTGIDILSINFRILNSISFIMATIFGVSVFRSDFKNNIIYQYLAFPISRTEYFFIRVIGTWFLVFLYYAYSYLLSFILFSFAFKKIVFTLGHLYSFGILGIYLLLVIFISIFFSLFMNKIGAIFLTMTTSIVAAFSFATFSVIPFSQYWQGMSSLKFIGLIFYLFFPRISFLDKLSSDFLANQSSGLVMWEQVAHLILITALYVFFANYLVKKKNF